MFTAVFNLTLEFCIWYFFVPAWLWNRVDAFMAKTNLCLSIPYRNDILQALFFILVWTLFNMIVGLPFSIYKTFVIEERWGYNKTTAGTFTCDLIKGFLITCVLTAIFLPLILWIIHAAGPALIPSLIGFSVSIILLINLLIPVVILPLFYTFSDLEDGELKTAIFAESEKTGIPVS